MRVIIAIAFITAPRIVMGGEYKVANEWPSGFHESFVRMGPENRPLCVAVKQATASDTPLQGPVSCKNPAFYRSSVLERPEWSPLDASRVLGVAKTLERLFEDSLNWTTHPSDKPEFLERMAQRLRAHTLTMATTTVVLAGHNEYATLKAPGRESSLILRYERWGCSESPNIVGPRVMFFIVEGSDFAIVKLLQGLGEPDDLFLYNNLAYFSSPSERTVDSHWRQLKQPQPELVVHELQDETYFVQICDLLYSAGAKKQ